ncbi:MAG TPA: SprT family zinc-dependent metalloprotease [Bacteroidales bacterium]|nr:SprT family zinc-dependent metalloprotease [Bacteroidales bacterium]
MTTKENNSTISYKVIFSSRRTIGISIRRDASVIVRVPYRTPEETIRKLVDQKSSWINKHTKRFLNHSENRTSGTYSNGETHLFKGKKHILLINESQRPYCRFNDGVIEIGKVSSAGQEMVKKILYAGYRKEAEKTFPYLLEKMVYTTGLRPSGLRIRTMKSRWGSCSSKGLITLNTDLIRLPEEYIMYVIIHELCHLKHHNHGAGFYTLLGSFFPEWKRIRKEIREYISLN